MDYVKTNNKNATYIEVDTVTTTTVTNSSDEDSWRGDSTSKETSFNGLIYKESSKNFYDLIYPCELMVDDKLYIVYVNYNTGDSFSNQDGEIDLIGIFKEKDNAIKCVEAIDNHYRSHKKNSNEFKKLIVPVDDQNSMHYSPPWIGYFDSMNYADYEEIKCLMDENISRVERVKMNKDFELLQPKKRKTSDFRL